LPYLKPSLVFLADIDIVLLLQVGCVRHTASFSQRCCVLTLILSTPGVPVDILPTKLC
jgi:hypothetical protein